MLLTAISHNAVMEEIRTILGLPIFQNQGLYRLLYCADIDPNLVFSGDIEYVYGMILEGELSLEDAFCSYPAEAIGIASMAGKPVPPMAYMVVIMRYFRYSGDRSGFCKLFRALLQEFPNIDISLLKGYLIYLEITKNEVTITDTRIAGSIDEHLKEKKNMNNGQLQKTPTPDQPLLVGLLIDVSASMQNSIQNRTGESLSRLESFRNSFEDLVSEAKELSYVRAVKKVAPLIKIFVYGFGFGNPLSSFFLGEKEKVRDLLKLPEATLSTIPIDQLAENWKIYKNHVGKMAFGMLGDTPMGEGFEIVEKRIADEIEYNSYTEQPILFVLSDGAPSDVSFDKIIDIANRLKESGVLIVSCFVTDKDIAESRHLYGQPLDMWSDEAKFMFECASILPEKSSFQAYLKEVKWQIEEKARLFTQINQSEVLSEFMRVILSPLMEAADKTSGPLPSQKQNNLSEVADGTKQEEHNMSENYIDFDLHIASNGHIVAHSPEGQAIADISTQLPTDIELALELIEERKTNAELLKKMGQSLYSWLFPDTIHTHFHQTEVHARLKKAKLRLRLHIEPATIASLPLEFIYRETGDYFLAVNPDTVLSRYLNLPLPPERVRRREDPLHMLAIIADPTDQTRLNPNEWETIINDATAKLCDDGRMTLQIVTRATRKKIRDALLNQKPDIIQFVGHGIHQDGKGYIALVDEDTNKTWVVDDERFANLFMGHDDNLGLISMATCESAQSANPQGFLGVAPQLVQRGGIPAVVAMQYEVYIKTAKVFMEDFYTSVAARKPVDWAVQSARNAVSLEFGLDNREFATPVLYMRAEDGNIF